MSVTGPSHVLRVVLQTGDELSHLFALEADLVDGREQREPAGGGGGDTDEQRLRAQLTGRVTQVLPLPAD